MKKEKYKINLSFQYLTKRDEPTYMFSLHQVFFWEKLLGLNLVLPKDVPDSIS
jgi:hypothetical protein